MFFRKCLHYHLEDKVCWMHYISHILQKQLLFLAVVLFLQNKVQELIIFKTYSSLSIDFKMKHFAWVHRRDILLFSNGCCVWYSSKTAHLVLQRNCLLCIADGHTLLLAWCQTHFKSLQKWFVYWGLQCNSSQTEDNSIEYPMRHLENILTVTVCAQSRYYIWEFAFTWAGLEFRTHGLEIYSEVQCVFELEIWHKHKPPVVVHGLTEVLLCGLLEKTEAGHK